MERIRPIWAGVLTLAFFTHSASAQEPAAHLPPPNITPPVPVTAPSTLLPGCGFGDGQGCGCGFYTGASLYLLKPYFSGGNTAYVTSSGGSSSPMESQTTTDFAWNMSASPATWIGWTSACGLGVRGRFFYFDQFSQTATTSLSLAQSNNLMSIAPPSTIPFPVNPTQMNPFGAPGTILIAGSTVGVPGLQPDQLAFTSSLRVVTGDLEATWTGRAGNWSWVIAGGGRYLQMGQNYSGTLTNSLTAAQGGPASELQSLNFNRTFNGFGPTLNFRGDYHIFATGLSLYSDLRGSFLVGSARQDATFARTIVDPNVVVGGSQNVGYNISTSRDTTMPVLEIELGAAYTFLLFRRLETSLSAGVVNQTYFDVGSASQTNGNLSLFGGRLSLGFQF